MKNKKMMAVGLSLVMAATLSIGCVKTESTKETGSTTPDSTKAPEATKKAPVKLVMWGGVPAESGPQAAVDAWNAKNPDIQVEYVRFVNDDAGNLKLDTALSTSQQVDMFMNYAFSTYEKRVKAGTAMDLSKYKDYNIDEKHGNGASFWKIDGKYYGMPTKKGVDSIWLNKNLLDEKGLPVPTDWTIDDMKEYAKKLKGDKRWGFMENDYQFMDIISGSLDKEGLVKPDGSSNYDKPVTGQVLQTFYDMMFKDKTMMPLGEQLTSKPPVDQMLIKGEAAMIYSTEQVFRTANNVKDFPRDFKIALAPNPKVSKDQKDFVTPGGLGDTLSINAKSKYQDDAWKFMKWYADEGMLPLVKGGRIPSSRDFKATDAIKVMFEGVEDKYDLESVKRVYFSDYPVNLPKVDAKTLSAQKSIVDKYFSNKLNLQETVNEMVKAHNEVLKAAKN